MPLYNIFIYIAYGVAFKTIMASMNPWEQPRTADMMDRFLNENEPVEEALAIIPSLFGVSDKATYLAYRALGFNTAQSLQIMELDEEYLDIWRSETPQFGEFEFKHLPRLQTETAAELIRLGFLKNMAMFVAKDAVLIRKSLTDFDFLSKREFDYLMKIRTHYTPGDMYNLDKALNPTKHQDHIQINLSWGANQAVEIEGVQAPYRLIEEGDNNGNHDSGSPGYYSEESNA